MIWSLERQRSDQQAQGRCPWLNCGAAWHLGFFSDRRGGWKSKCSRESLKRVPRAPATFVVCCQLQEGSGEVCGWGSREGLGRGNTPQCFCAGVPVVSPSSPGQCLHRPQDTAASPEPSPDQGRPGRLPQHPAVRQCKSAYQGGPDRLCGFPRLPIPNGSLSSIPFDFTLLVIKD